MQRLIKSILVFTGFLLFFMQVPLHVLAQEQPHKIHIVSDLDNYYSLSLKYDVSIDDLKSANPGIKSPKPGDTLIIPVKTDELEEDEYVNCDKLVKNRKEVYHIALMIPFSLEQVADSSWESKLDPAKITDLAPFRFVQFYDGFMLAVDSLKRQGLNAEIHVYDVDQSVSKVLDVLARPEMKQMDLIVGPFYKNVFSFAANFARDNQIPIVNPLSGRYDILNGNPYVFKMMPSVESQPGLVADLVRRDFRDYNIIFYTANKYQNRDLVEQYKQAIENNDFTGKQKVKVVDYQSDSIQGFYENASYIQPNLVIIFAENEVLPAALLGKLSELTKDYKISIIGIPDWEKFTNIESSYMIALDAHILIPYYTDYRREDVKGFVRSYREHYFDEPLNYAFSGFDAGFYFLNALMFYGKDFPGCLQDLKIPLIQNQFHFKHKGNNGYDNIYWNILEYYDYFLIQKSSVIK